MNADELRQATTLTPAEVGEVYGITSTSAIYRALEQGHIPGAFRLGKRWRIAAEPVRQQLGLDAHEPGEGTTLRTA